MFKQKKLVATILENKTIVILFLLHILVIYIFDFKIQKIPMNSIFIFECFLDYIFIFFITFATKDEKFDFISGMKPYKIIIYIIITLIILKFSFSIPENLVKVSGNIIPISLAIVFFTIGMILKEKKKFILLKITRKNIRYFLVIIAYILIMNYTNKNFYYKAILNKKSIFFYNFITFIFVAIFEEFYSRGVIFHYFLSKKINYQLCNVIQALIFSLFHIFMLKSHNASNVELFATLYNDFVAGLLFGIVYYKSKSLVYPIVLHTLMNVFLL